MTDELPSLDAIVTALHTHSDVAALAAALADALATLFPPEVVEVRRQRSGADRLLGRPGTVTEVSLRAGEAGDRTLTLSTIPVPQATVSHTVRGVRLSTAEVPLDEWLTMLGREVERRAATDDRARAAVTRFLLE